MVTLRDGAAIISAALAVVSLLVVTSAENQTTSQTSRVDVTIGQTTSPAPSVNVTIADTAGDGNYSDTCSTAANCLEGLVCTNSSCACPTGCDYDAQEIACNCGSAWRDMSTYLPLAIGLPINIIFWVVCFKCTKKQMTKKNSICLEQPLHYASPGVAPAGVFVMSGANTAPGYMGPSEASFPQRRQVNKSSLALAS